MPDIFIAENNTPAGKDPASIRSPASRNKGKSVISAGWRYPRRGMFPLSAFALHPLGVRFATQGEKEEINLFLRRHFVTNVPWITLSAVLLLAPVVLIPFGSDIIPFLSQLTVKASLVLTLFYYLVVLGAMVFASFLNWYFNVYIVTNERIVDVDFVNILYREVSSTRLNLIQDVTTKTGGAIRAVFNYGDVFIQTAGTEENFDFIAVPRPQEVGREIEKLMEESRKREGRSELEEALER